MFFAKGYTKGSSRVFKILLLILTSVFVIKVIYTLDAPSILPDWNNNVNGLTLFETPTEVTFECKAGGFLRIEDNENKVLLDNTVRNISRYSTVIYSNSIFKALCIDELLITKTSIIIANYTISLSKPSSPTLQPEGNENDIYLYRDPIFLVLNYTRDTNDAYASYEVRYSTWKGDNVDYETSTLYMFPVTINKKGSYTYVSARTFKIYPNGLRLASELVSQKYYLMKQCGQPVPNIKPGKYIDSSVTISFTKESSDSSDSTAKISIYVDDKKLENNNDKVSIPNDDKVHVVNAFIEGNNCTKSEIFTGEYTMELDLKTPTFNPPPELEGDNGFYAEVTISIECPLHSNVKAWFQGSSSLINCTSNICNVTIKDRSRIIASCLSLDESRSGGSILKEYKIYHISKPTISPEPKENVGPLNVDLTCSPSETCHILYTFDEDVEILPETEGVFDVQSNITLTISNPGVTLVRAVSFDPDFEEKSPEVSSRYYITGTLPQPVVSVKPDLNLNETIETKIFINTAVLNFDFQQVPSVAGNVLIINQDGTTEQNSKLTPFSLVLEQNCTVKINFTKLHYLPSSEYSYSIHMIKIATNPPFTFPSIPIVLTSELVAALMKAEIVVLIVALVFLSSLIVAVVLVIILKKYFKKKQEAQIRKFDLRFEEVELQQLNANEDDLFEEEDNQLV
ncbi:hypothetical protein ABK040_006919 [Willaertia magna]